MLLTILWTTIRAFDSVKDSYETAEDFTKIWRQCNNGKLVLGFKLQDGFLFKYNILFIPKTSLRLQLISEAHVGGLAGHFDKDKIAAQLENKFYWPGLRKETEKFIQRCPICQEAKGMK